MTRLGKILSRCRLVAAAITTGMALGSSGVAQTINWDGDGAQGNFSWNENWYGNNQPSWGFGNNLVFNFKNGSQTSLYYDYGDWRSIGDIIWETTWPVGVTFNGNGQGINFNQRIENRSYYTITIGSMNLSGGKNGASQIELNPVNGDLTLNGNIYNDNNLRYKVYGANQKLLTINTALGGNTGVALDIEQNSKVSITKAQTMGASAAFNIKQGELWLSVASALAGGSTINLGQADANTAKLYLNGADDSHAVTVANTSGTKVLGTISASGTQTFSGNITLNGNVLLEATQSGATVDFATGAISGNSGVTITGTGTVKLSGNNSYTGGTTVSAGTLLLGNNDRLSNSGSVTVSGGTFNLGLALSVDNLNCGIFVACIISTLWQER